MRDATAGTTHAHAAPVLVRHVYHSCDMYQELSDSIAFQTTVSYLNQDFDAQFFLLLLFYPTVLSGYDARVVDGVGQPGPERRTV